ncbi:putative leader peptide [Kitasatospora sp. MMS16-BH015]
MPLRRLLLTGRRYLDLRRTASAACPGTRVRAL